MLHPRVALGEERDHLLDKILLVLDVAVGSIPYRHFAVIPGLEVYSVHADHLKLPVFEPFRQRTDEGEILVLIKTSHGGGERDDRTSPGAEKQQLHFPVEIGAVPLMVFAMHSGVAP
jgi:hypothetical protein